MHYFSRRSRENVDRGYACSQRRPTFYDLVSSSFPPSLSLPFSELNLHHSRRFNYIFFLLIPLTITRDRRADEKARFVLELRGPENRNCGKEEEEREKGKEGKTESRATQEGRVALHNTDEVGRDIGRRRGRNRYFFGENKGTATKKEDGKAEQREMIAQQRVSRPELTYESKRSEKK